MLSCGRVKTEFSKMLDVSASTNDASERAPGSLGTARGNFVYLFWDFEDHTGIFSKTLLLWTRIFFDTDKRDAFSEISEYV